MMTSQELEQVTFLFLKQLYEIVDATNAPIYQINLTKVADSVGLKTIPSQDVLYSNFPTSYPTLEDAIKICNAMRTIKQKTKTVTQKEVDELIKQRDELKNEITVLSNLRDELHKQQKELADSMAKLKAKDTMNKELKALYEAASDFATAIVQIKNEYTNI